MRISTWDRAESLVDLNLGGMELFTSNFEIEGDSLRSLVWLYGCLIQ
jgi:hypothetical protein